MSLYSFSGDTWSQKNERKYLAVSNMKTGVTGEGQVCTQHQGDLLK